MRKQGMIIACAVAVAGATGVAVAAPSDDTGASAPKVALQPTSSADARLAENLGLFRDGGAGEAATVPMAIRAIVEDLAPTTGANWQLARAVKTPAGPVYVVPSEAGVCQVGPGVGGCGTLDALADDPSAYTLFGYSLGINPPGTISVSGIVTDEVRSITGITADGASIDVPLTTNVYASFIPDEVRTLVFATGDGRELTRKVPVIDGATAEEVR